MSNDIRDEEAKAIIQTKDAIKQTRGSYDSVCSDVARLFSPEDDTLSSVSEGAEVLQPITSVGINALERMTGGLYSNTMAMGKGNIMDSDKEIMEDPNMQEWYAELSNDTHHIIHQSDFPRKYLSMLRGFGLRGTGVTYVKWCEKENAPEFYVYPVNSCFYGENNKGKVDSMYREFSWTAAQAVAEFGLENMSDEIQKAYEKRDGATRFDFIHCMRPNRNRDEDRIDAQNMPFESIYVEVKAQTIAKRSGSMQFRYVVTTMYIKDDEIVGRSASMKALPACRTIMKAVSDHMDGIEIAVGPPLFLPDRNSVDKADLEPFAVNFYNPDRGQPWLYQNASGALQLSHEFIATLTDEIERLHFVDLFNMLEQSKGQMTAYQVSQMVAERSQGIAPISGSLNNYFGDTYRIVGNDLIYYEQVEDHPFKKKEDIELSVKYTSRLDVRLNELEGSAMMEAIIQASELSAAYDQSIYIQAVVDILPTVTKVFEAHNVDPDTIRNADDAGDELKRIMDEIAQAQQAEQEAQGMKPIDLQKSADAGSPMEQIVNDASAGVQL